METVMKLVSLLIICAMVSEGRVIRRQSSSDPYMDCYINRHVNCVAPNLDQYNDLMSTPESTGEFLSNRSNIEDLANATQTTVECFDLELLTPACLGVKEEDLQDGEITLIAEFLASSDNIDILFNLSSSPCFTDAHLLGSLEQAVPQCATSFIHVMQMLGDVCTAMLELKNCWASSAGSVCGPAASDLIQSLWDFALEAPKERLGLFQLPVPASMVEQCFASNDGTPLDRSNTEGLNAMIP